MDLIHVMAFVEPNNLLYGISELPARLYGGVVHSGERISHQNTNHSFIPLQNTSAFRRNELLFPRASTVPVPIAYIPAVNYKTEVNRLKRIEADYYLKPEYHTLEQNRNLLAGEATSEDTVRLWVVDDNSDRNLLHDFSFQFDFPNDPHLPVRVNREQDLLEQANEVELSAGALELRAYNQYEQTNKVFIRTEANLQLYNSDSQELSVLYKWPLRYFERMAYMDEVAVVTNEGLAFFAKIGLEEFGRIKSEEKIISVATTDCPAELLLSSKEKVCRVDVRAHTSTSDLVFSLNKDEWNIVDPISQAGVNYLMDRERIWHVKNVKPETETYFVTTTQRIFVFDRRMPNLPLFYTNHFNFNGGECVLTGGPFFHQRLKIDVYQYFSLSRFLKPCISNWAIGWNRQEAVWTSMGPKCDLDSFEDVLNLCQSQTYLPHVPEEIKDRLPEVTRAIHYQHFSETLRPNENRSILFRQMDNGQIWFDSIQFSKPKAYCAHEGIEKEPEATKRSVEEFITYISEALPTSIFFECIDETEQSSFKECLESRDYKQLMKTFKSSADNWRPIMDADVSHIELDNIDELICRYDIPEYEEALEAPAVEPFSEQHALSKVVIDMTTKTKKLLNNEDELNIVKDNEQVEDEQVQDEENSRPPSSLNFFKKSEKESQPFGQTEEDWF